MELGALPDELCRHVALFLPASDVLRLLTDQSPSRRLWKIRLALALSVGKRRRCEMYE
jgi:hypothetical protein